MSHDFERFNGFSKNYRNEIRARRRERRELATIVNKSSDNNDNYTIDTLNKIMASLKADPIPVPSDKEGYFAWLKDSK